MERPADRPAAVPRPTARTGRQEGEAEHAAELRVLGQDVLNIFFYFEDVQGHIADHADHFDHIQAWEKVRMKEVADKGYAITAMRQELAATKALLDSNDANLKQAVLDNDLKLAAAIEDGLQGVDAHFKRVTEGIGKEFAKYESVSENLDIKLKELLVRHDQDKINLEYKVKELQMIITAAPAAAPPGLATAPGVASSPAPLAGPSDLTGCGQLQLRSDVRELAEKMASFKAR